MTTTPLDNAAAGLFIYYKVDSDYALPLASAVRRMQSELMALHAGLVAKLWSRSDSHTSHQTWMESYEHPTNTADLITLIEQAALTLPAGRLGDRHLESFITV